VKYSTPENLWLPKSRENLNPETVRIIKKVLDKIPQLPVSVQKIIEMTSYIDIGAKELAEVALTDPVLSSKIITLVNSAYYGLNRRIDDLRVAIVLIGFNAVQNIAIQNRFLQILESYDDSLYDREKLWVHSYLVSICAESFISDDNPQRMGILMTMGILHDIGKFALYEIGKMMKKKGIKIPSLDDIPSDTHLLKKEEIFFGVNHSTISGILASKWNLSERISTVLEYHHYPSFFAIHKVPPKYLEDIIVICLADLVVNRFMGEGIQLPEPHHTFFDVLGLKPPIENLLTDELISKLLKAREFVHSLA